MSSRKEAKDQRRRELLVAAADIMASKGFNQTRFDDVGAAVGISGPGLYRYFSSKGDLLAEMLIEISTSLLENSTQIVTAAREEGTNPTQALRRLVDFHVDFAITQPNLIRVQQREMMNLEKEASEKVRSLQRAYLRLWSDVLLAARPELGRKEARLRAQLASGLVTSVQFVIHWAGEDLVRTQATQMAISALLADGE
ncbi:TetR/AcrR family transcriptional regulator [Corynebacterium lubricantis]|uniref:TetR/AcrR family transcriptional regulator n=1 Tax=Corynebacterium lubricantis TaxID=541095 RepID=UPI00036D2B05|nr:TetR/AcrR family transcriptional regulator [Corynebacterium lubricantis]